MTTTVIRDALVVPGAPAAPFVGWVLVRDGVVADLGEGPPPRADHVIEGADRALLPGLVNAHAHSHSSLTRGSAEGLSLGTWIAAIEREQPRLTAEQSYWGAMATYAEALLSGTTTIMDMCLQPAPAARAAAAMGIRAVIAPYVASAKPFAPTLEDTAALFRATAGEALATGWVGLHDAESCDDAQIRAGAAMAEAAGVGLHLHCAETAGSVAPTVARTGRSPVAHLRALGALGARTVLAHCVAVDDADLTLLAAAGAHVVHNPHANLKLGSGVAPVPAMLARGINVALGTDGAKANNRLDMFDVMKFASLLPKGVACDPTLLPPGQVLAMATAHGGAALGLPVGRIAPGLAADLILVRTDRLHLTPAVPATIESNLVHAARGSDVDTVIVGGRVVVAGGTLLSADLRAILRELDAAGRALLAA